MKRKFYLDLLERSAWTFVQAFAAFWATFEYVMDVSYDWTDLFFAAAVAAGISVAKGVASTQLPWANKDDASTLPPSA